MIFEEQIIVSFCRFFEEKTKENLEKQQPVIFKLQSISTLANGSDPQRNTLNYSLRELVE